MEFVLAEEQPFFYQIRQAVFCERGMMPEKLVWENQGYFIHDSIQNKVAL
jgi:hypothetical protein